MSIDRDTVYHTARLARIDLELLPAAEAETLAAQMESIVAYVELLRELPTEGVEPTVHPIPLTLVPRDAAARETPGAAAVLASAPAHDGATFLVPRVVGQEDSDG